jgi:hypothetical protein
MCEICIGNTTEPLLCTACQTTQGPQQQESFWTESTPYIRDEGQTRQYLLFGIIGAILWMIVIGIETVWYIELYYDPFGSYFNLISTLFSLSQLIQLFEPILIGLGFLALYYKFDKVICKYTFWVSIIGVIIDYILGFTYPILYGIDYYFGLTVIYGFNISISLFPAVALLSIRDRVQSSGLALIIALGYIFFWPWLLMVVLAFSPIFPFAWIPHLITSLLLIIFFMKERGESALINQAW